MKRGFTLVEMAIVVLLIGLIIGMTISGGELVKQARVRSEVMKLRKIETAVAAYIMTSNKSLPPDSMDDLIASNLLSQKDIYSEFSSQVHNRDYKLSPCYGGLGSYAVNPAYTRNRCAYLLNMETYLICNIELVFDDQRVDKGFGRTISAPGSSQLINNDHLKLALQDCDNTSLTYFSSSTYGMLVY